MTNETSSILSTSYTRQHVDHDVIILGAGPAGTSTAIRLAALGFNVGIVENLRFPRAHVGICLSETTLELLNYLAPGIPLDDPEHWSRKITAVRWGTSQTNYIRQPGLHVDRGVLDRSMLGKACADGVSTYHPAKLVDIDSMDDAGWRITIATESTLKELKTHFIVDATGKRSTLSNTRRKDSPPLIALHAYWDVDKPKSFDGLIEAGDNAWLWYAQTASRQASVSVFCAPETIRERHNGDLQKSYIQLLRQFRSLVPGDFERQSSHPLACDATSRHSADPVSNRHIRVGDACLSIDPLSSQGVHLALLSGIQAATIINTILRKPENRELAIRFFRSRISEKVKLYTNRTRTEYSRVSAVCSDQFWHERADDRTSNAGGRSPEINEPEALKTGAIVRIAPELKFTREPVLKGDFVEEGTCVRHPNIDGAIAYLGGTSLASLLSLLPDLTAYDEIPTFWQNILPTSRSDEVRRWLWEKRILVTVDPDDDTFPL